ncbi:efflux RND transporter permease subunit [Duncaniella sp.]|uniref:efflux RND transporter permease subunit n=1 Tax=Duncaniella sp. TaxID=2518496 RepID=UPI0023CEB3DD|nr:multidrug efflux RND transporter permease subunit [Duncaniella sp.]MDE5904080.1 efflux RND transporter permease subunit [Duncaniella sp.]
MFSRFFIDRPIFATVIAIIMVLVGLMTVKSLPVSQYPDITPPTVMVSASYPGADAATIAEVVGTPIEEQINGVEGMMYMSSSSSDGSYSLTITFENGTNLDDAAVKVQNRISLAEATLPTAVKEQGVSVMAESSDIILFIALEGDNPDRYNALYLTNYAQLNIIDELSRIDGVGGAGAFGAGKYSMRVWLDPEKMRVRGITPSDVSEMIQSQNLEVSSGNVGAPPAPSDVDFEFTLTSDGQLQTAEEFGNIILKTDPNGSILRLKDVATVELGSESYSTISHVSGKQAGLIGVQQRPGANALDVATKVKAKMDELSEYFPDGVHYEVIMDTTSFVNASIDEVLMTFVETTLIVMIVILIFLQSWRAVIIPMIAIPVSLIATFAVMKLLGFSINTLTLFGLVLAIAIVVDDAIVVVEDCARLVQEGKLTPRQSAEKAMKELQGPVVGEVLVLLSVFIPTAFISGITGELYKQFALTIATSVAFSGFNALTFTPAMCALFLRKKEDPNPHFFIYKWFNKGYGSVIKRYTSAIGCLLQRPLITIGIYVIICLFAFWGFMKLPTSYIPQEDMGYFMTSVQLPTGASLDRTDKVVTSLADQIKKIPEVDNVISISGSSMMGGGSGANMGSLFVVLKPWSQRKGKGQDVDAVMAHVSEIADKYQEPIVFSINPPAIPGLGMTSGMQMQILDINNLGADALQKVLTAMKEEAKKDDRIAQLTTQYQAGVPQYAIKVDRDKAKLLGLSVDDIYSTLAQFMGGSYVNDFIKFGRTYQVNLSADSEARSRIGKLGRLSVRNANGDMVPFSSFMSIEPTIGQSTVSRYNMYTTASITGTPASHVSSKETIKAMEEILDEAVGDQFAYAWTGEAYQETQAGTTITFVLLFAVIVTILVLSAQYESWTDPIAVVISMPTAILGTVIGCLFLSQSISIYTQIGIILLLGLSAKNAILIVEYARDFRQSGQSVREAASDAGVIRFRPIMMTAFAFVFGVLPMLFATGAGANSRIALGTAVVFGMAVNAIVGTLFVPGFWELLENFREKHLSKIFAGSDQASKRLQDTDKSTSGEEN